MIISNNYNNLYFQKSKKAENKENKKDTAIDKIKTINQQNSEIATDFAAALLMPKINFVVGLFDKKDAKPAKTDKTGSNN